MADANKISISEGQAVIRELAEETFKDFKTVSSPSFWGEDHYHVGGRDLFIGLADRALSHAQKSDWTINRFREELSACLSLIELIKEAVHPTRINDPKWQAKTASFGSVKDVEKFNHGIWSRHDPMVAFHDGDISPHFVEVAWPALYFGIEIYLSAPHLRTAQVDWLILDILVSQQLCSIGERTKIETFGMRTWSGEPTIYEKARGNSQEMAALNFKREAKKTAKVLLIGGAAPLAVGMLLSSSSPNGSAFFVGIGMIVILVWISLKLLRLLAKAIEWVFGDAQIEGRHSFVIRLIRRIAGKSSAADKNYKRWNSMVRVWRLLGSGMVNPSRLRAAMERASDEGVIWHNAAWAIIDRAAALGPDEAWLKPPISTIGGLDKIYG
jgi:hypothetical protein